MPKILLTTLNAKYIHLNLAIRILYDLNKDLANLDWIEFTIKNEVEEVAEHCAQYDVVCFSCYIWNITQTLNVCKAIKTINPNTKILLGGPEVSYEWEEVIVREDVDFIIVGEGEIPFAQFVTHYPSVEFVPNLVYKKDYEIKFNQQNVQFNVLELANRNPYQYEDPSTLKTKVAYIETSRGCPYKCEFCLASLDNKVRYLPMDTIKHNLKYLMDHGKTIKFLDRTFNIKKDFTIELFQFILDNHKPGNVFQFEITADIVHPEIIKFVNEHVPKGLFRFEIGIQTVNQESNLEVSRKQNFEKTSKVIKQLEERIEMHLDLIVGLPLEYWDDLKFSFESTFKLYPPELQLGFLKFLKGTPVREKYEQYGYVFDPNPPYQIIKSNFLSEQELHDIEILENALEIYWNKKRLCHTLKYIAQHHSIFDCLLGLGQYFQQKSDFHKHTLKDVYVIAQEYIQTTFQDALLNDLLILDYYLFHKIKPQDIFNVEMEQKQKNKFVVAHELDHHRKRFSVFPVHFNMRDYVELQQFNRQKDLAIISFDGNHSAEIVFVPEVISM